nr:hypothetical protein [Pseudomonas chlororaphis]
MPSLSEDFFASLQVNPLPAATFHLRDEDCARYFFCHAGTLCWCPRSVKKTARQAGYLHPIHKESAMDDYQEELLEFQAFELDPLEPAEDATEL